MRSPRESRGAGPGVQRSLSVVRTDPGLDALIWQPMTARFGGTSCALVPMAATLKDVPRNVLRSGRRGHHVAGRPGTEERLRPDMPRCAKTHLGAVSTLLDALPSHPLPRAAPAGSRSPSTPRRARQRYPRCRPPVIRPHRETSGSAAFRAALVQHLTTEGPVMLQLVESRADRRRSSQPLVADSASRS